MWSGPGKSASRLQSDAMDPTRLPNDWISVAGYDTSTHSSVAVQKTAVGVRQVASPGLRSFGVLLIIAGILALAVPDTSKALLAWLAFTFAGIAVLLGRTVMRLTFLTECWIDMQRGTVLIKRGGSTTSRLLSDVTHLQGLKGPNGIHQLNLVLSIDGDVERHVLYASKSQKHVDRLGRQYEALICRPYTHGNTGSPLINSHTTTDVDSAIDGAAGGDGTRATRPPDRR